MSRESILCSIKNNKPPAKGLPEISKRHFYKGLNLREAFINNVEAVGGKTAKAKNIKEAAAQIESLTAGFTNIISIVEDIKVGTIISSRENSAKSFEKLEAAVLKAQFGIAENGAVWVTDKNFSHRSIPFITLHLFLLLSEKELVENMHDAYERLSLTDDGYGVFISGPSKTADIEQSLVIGAQGPLSTTVILVEDAK